MAESSINDSTPDPTSTSAVQVEQAVPEIFQLPTRPLSWTWRLLFALASIVPGMCNVTIKQLLLPAQVALLFPSTQFTAFAVVASTGAIAGVLITPLSGAISDRTISRFGRRPWIVFGAVFVVIGLVLIVNLQITWADC